MKKWEFVYKTKSGREKVINNENCWKHLEEDIWRGIAWCGDHFIACLAIGGAGLLAVAAGKQIKKSKSQEPEGEIVFIADMETAKMINETLAGNSSVTTETV